MGQKRGFINKAGVEVIPPTYAIVGKFSNGLARAYYPNDKWGFIDRTGKQVIAPKYDDAEDFIGGLSAVSVNGKKFVIDITGKTILVK